MEAEDEQAWALSPSSIHPSLISSMVVRSRSVRGSGAFSWRLTASVILPMIDSPRERSLRLAILKQVAGNTLKRRGSPIPSRRPPRGVSTPMPRGEWMFDHVITGAIDRSTRRGGGVNEEEEDFESTHPAWTLKAD